MPRSSYQILYCQAYYSTVGHRSLPWQGLKASEDKRNEGIREKKVNTPIEDLCDGLPDAFANYFHYIQTLRFNSEPNYSYLRKLFRDLFVREGFEYDHLFDWTVKEFNMMYGNIDQPIVPKPRSSKKGNNDLTDEPSASHSSSSSFSLRRLFCMA
jgi:hypothetical protein